MQSQKAVSAYVSNKQILALSFSEQYYIVYFVLVMRMWPYQEITWWKGDWRERHLCAENGVRGEGTMRDKHEIRTRLPQRWAIVADLKQHRVPANTTRWTNVGSMLGRCRRRRECFEFTGTSTPPWNLLRTHLLHSSTGLNGALIWRYRIIRVIEGRSHAVSWHVHITPASHSLLPCSRPISEVFDFLRKNCYVFTVYVELDHKKQPNEP